MRWIYFYNTHNIRLNIIKFDCVKKSLKIQGLYCCGNMHIFAKSIGLYSCGNMHIFAKSIGLYCCGNMHIFAKSIDHTVAVMCTFSLNL